MAGDSLPLSRQPAGSCMASLVTRMQIDMKPNFEQLQYAPV